jgi:competence ComEA-like helix-hairpin-helix protein
MEHMKLVALVVPLFVCSFVQAQDLPEGKGKKLVQDVCGGCHGVDAVIGQRATKEGWESIVGDMVSRGASASNEDIQTIIDYLTKNFGPEPSKVNVNKATAKEIESGLELTTTEAETLVKYRQDHGDFKDWDGLTKAGVDPKKLEPKKDRIVFN